MNAHPIGSPRIARPSIVLLTGVVLTFGLAGHAHAQRPPNVTAGELALVPEYCADTMGFNYGAPGSGKVSPRADYWVARMGPDFWAMHHYCWGLIKLSRALQAGVPAMHRTNGIIDAIKEYDFVMSRTSPEFVMVPELLLRRGEAYIALGNVPAAFDSFEAAIKRKPDYWPAYHRMADVLLKAGSKPEARAMLERGLAVAPDEPALRSLYQQAGGDLAARRVAAPPPASAASGPSSSTN